MLHPIRHNVLLGLLVALVAWPALQRALAQSTPAPAGPGPAAKANPGAGSRGQAPKSKSTEAPAKAVVFSPADLERRALAVVTYDGGEVTVGELEDAIAQSSPFAQQRALEPAALRALLDRSIRFEMMAAEAERRGYAQQDSVAQAVRQNSVQLMIKREVDEKVTPAAVPADEVAKYYQEHVSEFVRPQMRRASQILLANEADAKALAAQVKAADMRAFRELARQKSVDETNKLRGGDLRYFDPTGKPEEAGAEIDPALVKAAYALKNSGDKSDIIKTSAGYAYLMLTGVRPAHEESLKQAEERIRMRLWRQLREKAIDALYQELKQTQAPVTHPELLDAIVFAAEPASAPGKGAPTDHPHAPAPPAEPKP